eukprot:139661-Hanusia_phi.AAC.4
MHAALGRGGGGRGSEAEAAMREREDGETEIRRRKAEGRNGVILNSAIRQHDGSLGLVPAYQESDRTSSKEQGARFHGDLSLVLTALLQQGLRTAPLRSLVSQQLKLGVCRMRPEEHQ